jgi:hypothetical protein
MNMNRARILKAGRPLSGPAAFLVPLALLFGACSQNAIFYNISQEVEIRDPAIKGTPTNIVYWENKLYAANSESLYCYADPAGRNNNPVWSAVPSPPGQIQGLAATKTALYVLTDTGLYIKTGLEAEWAGAAVDESDEGAGNYPYLQNIYADADAKWLFAGSSNGYPAGDSANYAILYTDEESKKLRALKTGTGLLSGAAFNGSVYFVSTYTGIFTAAETSGAPALTAGGPVENTSREITGIIRLEDGNKTIAAVDRGGALWTVTADGYTDPNIKITRSTGALALWRTPPSDPDNPGQPDGAKPRLLLLGLQGSITSTSQSYVNGYREIALNANGGLDNEVSPVIPGDGESITNRPKYESSLGILIVNHLFQAPYSIDKNMTLFAAVQGEQGLWSYRDHGDGDVVWNAE